MTTTKWGGGGEPIRMFLKLYFNLSNWPLCFSSYGLLPKLTILVVCTDTGNTVLMKREGVQREGHKFDKQES